MFERLQQALQRGEDILTLRNEPDALAPETLMVFETRGAPSAFAKACEEIGLRILADDDLEFVDDNDEPAKGHYYLTMPDQRAINELLRLWTLWTSGGSLGQNAKWESVFSCLYSLRRWGPRDRVTDEDAATIAEDAQLSPKANVRLEIELAFDPDETKATANRALAIREIENSGGSVRNSSRFAEIAYDALLVDVEAAAAADIAARTDGSLARLVEIFAIRPQSSLKISTPVETETSELPVEGREQGSPIAAILDAVPQQNHALLGGRLLVEDFLDLEPLAVGPRVHGTAMASLVLHGDLAKREPPLGRRVAFIPIMYSAVNDPNFVDEAPPTDALIVDLLVRTIGRLKVGDANSPPIGPDVFIVNLSIGDTKRPFGNRVSAFARALDWLAALHGILFLVSAGNHDSLHIANIDVASYATSNGEQRTRATLFGLSGTMHSRRLLPPSEAMNCLTIGALHDDEIAAAPDVGHSRDPLPFGVFANPVSRMGLGYRSSVKPDLLFPGGRLRAILRQRRPNVADLDLQEPNRLGGLLAAGPGPSVGARYPIQHSGSTSGATALATRACHLIHEGLEAAYEANFVGLPSAARAVVIKALLVHRASVPDESRSLIHDVFGPQGKHRGRERTANVLRHFGFGIPDVEEVLGCTGSRATLWAEGQVGENDGQLFSLPLPACLSGVRGVRRLSVTLAWFTPVQPGRRAYKGVRLKVEEPEFKSICSRAAQGQSERKPRGTIYHRTWEGTAARNFVDGERLELRVARDPDQGDELPDLVRFGLAVTLEVEDDALPIYEEVRAMLKVQPRVAVRVGA
ncbi:S8 family peptidase [Bradyrhizobium sp. LMG 9283]|uniref:S8 family peptidase n=1 Tax=Bradyrhizobium sp. LMG 9283 TaxID=592064 RepID=UPI00388E64A3